MRTLFLVLVCYSLYCVKSDIPEDARLNFTQLAKKYGHKCEEFDVITEDNYILKLFHIEGDKTKPILLGHGILTSADCFIIRGKSSPAIALAERGYDVWVLNVRGNKYSRRHVTLNPDTDKEFWDFSFHEMGMKDLPANIDFVLNKTNQSKLIYIGHSQGNQMSFVLGSLKSEYNAKVKVYIALSPVAFLHNLPMPISLLPILWPPFKIAFEVNSQEEFLNPSSYFARAAQSICLQEGIGYKICAEGIIFHLIGPNPTEMEPEFFPVYLAHHSSSSSRKNADHLIQIVMRKKFAQFDYGLGNLEVYGALEPLDYPLKNITTPVVLMVGQNDRIADKEDVKILKSQLPNVYYHEMHHKEMNHADFFCGKNMKLYLYPFLFEVLQKYT